MNPTFKKVFSVTLIIFCSYLSLFSQAISDSLNLETEIDSVNENSSETNPIPQPENIEGFSSFDDLHIGYYGTTQNCLPYSIYGFKYKRTWFFIAKQETEITFLVNRPPRTEGKIVVPGSEFLLTGIDKAHINTYTKLKKRRRIIKDIEIYGFYKFNKPGRKAMKGILLLEFPEVDAEPSWPFKWIAEKAAEAKESAKGVIPEINAGQAVNDKAAEAAKALEGAVPEVKLEVAPPKIPGK